MRRRTGHRLAALCILAGLLLCATAAVREPEGGPLITGVERDKAAAALEMRDMGEATSMELLYNLRGEASHILILSPQGYLIMDRATLICLEGGESNPYRDYPDARKYYAGPIAYYVARDGILYDFRRERVAGVLPV